MDPEYLHSYLGSVLPKIADGSRLTDHVPIKRDYGRKVEVRKALTAGASLRESFHPDDWDAVRKAFSRFGAEPPSSQIDDCCRALLKLMS